MHDVFHFSSDGSAGAVARHFTVARAALRGDAEKRLPGVDEPFYPLAFAASSILCTSPPGCDRAMMLVFCSAAGAVQMDQLNQ